jgi:gas vesicle protein
MKRETSNVLVAFLLGAVAGTVTALLLAPASGADTRKKLNDALKHAKDKALDELETAKDFADTHRQAIKEAYSAGKEAYKKATHEKEA